jgi:hypothetical protein
MSKALNATGRPILYSLCNWGEIFPGIGAQQLPTPGGFQETFTTHGTPLIPVALVMERTLTIVNFLAFIAR